MQPLIAKGERGRFPPEVLKCSDGLERAQCFRPPVALAVPWVPFQHPHGGSLPSTTSVPGHPIPPPDLLGHQACTWHIHIHTCRQISYTENKKNGSG